jgi:rhamnose transport system ATP-binding protein
VEKASDGAAEAREAAADAGTGTAGTDAGRGNPAAADVRPATGDARPATGDARPASASAVSPGTAPVLVLRHAAKSFGAVQALIDGSIELYPGEAHALVGENGAGKSTLVKILAGVFAPDAGSLEADGREVSLHGPAAALAAGIAVIYQEPSLFPDLTVAENMFIGRQPLSSGRRIDRRAMRTEAAEIFARLGVPLDPARIARGLSIADPLVV